ncbi:MAG: acyl-CoA dehydrogenase C-terminal domain-containing protein [Pseudomonadales bacterium]|nr:acyl-CoA dehydrogenase C-terminal domain-containing protein [Pseudomonadales bacterium]MCP5329480.1 acyl-CoA dehydrogenase C-terminal domain-containing protein [Pseudomonadales bacterium]MCP5344976.1 acyl-CoA dehydrogenase C-terminal domain-containing protein [Pseudomonadales bacterium]
MSSYRAPMKDMRFVLHEVQEAASLLRSMPGTEELSEDLMDAVLEGAAQVCEDLLLPLNRTGDEEGCHFEAGRVRTPAGFREAYAAYAEGGWIGLSGDVAYGGQGMPKVLAVLVEEMMMAANTSFALYPALSAGACLALAHHGSEALKQAFLPRLYSGEWSGTMCLTEPHAGTDLGMLKTRAEPDGEAYRVSGSKIFITGGEHDLCENIVHLVLARLPDAPPGPKGISLFLVPRMLPDSAELNGVSCGAIEHKMGIRASATCVMNFDNARGYLVGEPNKGLSHMFTMMNYERLSIGLQGLGLADHSYQIAAAYARERRQGRAGNGALHPEEVADPIIVHPDVRRMLLTVRADVEAGRALAVYVAAQLDRAHLHEQAEVRERAARLVSFLTPVAKAAFSDRGFEACVLAQQVLGGHGYVREWGLEQHVRDARIAQIYEGTNGIQALDLAGRKLVRDRDGLLETLIEEIEAFLPAWRDKESAHWLEASLRSVLGTVQEASQWLRERGAEDADEIGAASVPYLRLVTLLLYTFMWARMVSAAERALAAGAPDAAFYEAKLKTARFFVERVLPGGAALLVEIRAGAASVMAMDADQF